MDGEEYSITDDSKAEESDNSPPKLDENLLLPTSDLGSLEPEIYRKLRP